MESFELRTARIHLEIDTKLNAFKHLFTQELAEKHSECGPCTDELLRCYSDISHQVIA